MFVSQTLEMDHTSSCISITLATSADGMDTQAAGYAPPDDEHDRKPISDADIAVMDSDKSSGDNTMRRNGNSSRRHRRNRARGRRRGSSGAGAANKNALVSGD